MFPRNWFKLPGCIIVAIIIIFYVGKKKQEEWSNNRRAARTRAISIRQKSILSQNKNPVQAQRNEIQLPLIFEGVSKASQDDPGLIKYLRDVMIMNPSNETYHLSNPNKADPTQVGQGQFLTRYFKNKKGGTFIEAGALDGERFSNTLILERKYGWKGLLVEPDPLSFKNLTKKNRKVHSINCCLSPLPTPEEVVFSIRGLGSRIYKASHKHLGNDTNFTKAKCIPLYSLMLAMNLTTLDFLSLDVEGVEVKVLKTLPWEKINIDAILVEKIFVPEGPEELRRFMEGKNYKLKKSIGGDFFFSKIY